eukprot:9941010-Prorocentrum_lima.AAC.1
MTSSLVGSEMCIRDRKKGEPTLSTKVARKSHVFRSSRGQVPLPGFLVPVSYTHLTLPTICSV